MEYTIYCQFDRKDLTQYMSFARRLRYQKLYTALYVVVVTVLALAALLMLYFGLRQNLTRDTVVRVVLLYALAGFWFLSNEFRISLALKGHRKTGPFTVRFTEKQIVFETGEKRTESSYEGFTELYQFRGTYYLFISRTQPFILPSHCFTQGDPAAFGAFLAEKTGLEVKELN